MDIIISYFWVSFIYWSLAFLAKIAFKLKISNESWLFFWLAYGAVLIKATLKGTFYDDISYAIVGGICFTLSIHFMDKMQPKFQGKNIMRVFILVGIIVFIFEPRIRS
ncbi:MAG: hypothetical protein JKY25_03125 [Robiginitomaculum sp.]|nr:hypothetical protein [Robiginitomaculum sp.]